MNRRDFMAGAASLAATLSVDRIGLAQKARQPDPAKLARIAIMTFNFNSILKFPTAPESPNRTMEVFDVPEMLADTYGVHNVEFQHTHVASTETSYLKELRARLEKSQSRMSNVNLEFGPLTISAADAAQREQAVQQTKQWVDHAIVLGCPRVMINQGQPTDENKVWGIPALRAMGDYARSKGIMLSVETRLNFGRGRGGAPVPAAGAVPVGAAPATMAPPATAPATIAPPPATPPVSSPGANAPSATAPVPAGTAPATPAVAGAPGAVAGPGRGAPPPPATPMTTPPTWVLLAQLIKDSGTYSNVDIGNVGAQDQGELHAALRALLPMTVGNIHTRINPNWDLPTALRFITGPLEYKGLFSIEANGHDAVRHIYNIILDTI